MAKFLGLVLMLFGALLVFSTFSEATNNSILYMGILLFGGFVFVIGLFMFFSRKKN